MFRDTSKKILEIFWKYLEYYAEQLNFYFKNVLQIFLKLQKFKECFSRKSVPTYFAKKASFDRTPVVYSSHFWQMRKLDENLSTYLVSLLCMVEDYCECKNIYATFVNKRISIIHSYNYACFHT